MVSRRYPLFSSSSLTTSLVDSLAYLFSSIPGAGRLLLAGAFSSTIFAVDAFQDNTFQPCSNPQLSCPSKPPSNINTCCLNHPSGHFLLTQFWDTSPALGAKDAWTIHGLWPDLCTGGFDQFCSHERSYHNITAILKSMSDDADGNSELVDFMNNHWLSINGDNEDLWAHEWNKHGTCISTIEPTCYDSDASKFISVVDYFTHATNLYHSLNTYSALQKAGIIPSTSETYTLAELESAIAQQHDSHPVTFRCNYRHELDEIWYHYTVRGPLRGAVSSLSPQLHRNAKHVILATEDLFVPADPDGSKTNCPAQGIRYLPKSHDGAPSTTRTRPSTTSTSKSEPTNSARPFSGRGHLLILPKSNSNILTAPVTRSQIPLNLPDHPVLLQDSHQRPLSSQRQPPSSSEISEADFQGCLIRAGKWYTSGSCATYLAKEDANHVSNNHNLTHHLDDHSIGNDADDSKDQDVTMIEQLGDDKRHLFTLSSLYAPCAILPDTNEFKCGKDLGVQSIFEAVDRDAAADDHDNNNSNEDGEVRIGNDELSERRRGSEKMMVLGYRGSTKFYAEKIPGRFEKVSIFAGVVGDEKDVDGLEKDMRSSRVEVEIHWRGI